MTETKPPGGASLYRGPSRSPRDKRERERDRAREHEHEHRRDSGREHATGARAQSGKPASRPPLRERVAAAQSSPVALPSEQRIHGLNACLALFAKRPEALRKVWLLESRIPHLKPVLAHCVKHRLGYSVVEAEDLEKLSGSAHHEGVVFGALAAPELSLSQWLQELHAGPQIAVWLDGVGNPHNLGAILRNAAHFGVAGVMLPKDSALALSGAAIRVAEGGAEAVPMVRLGRSDNAIAQLASAGFVMAATVVRGGRELYSTALPERLLLVMGAEQVGVDAELLKAAKLKLAIPGSGAVDSLNVASATAVMLGEWWRQRKTAVR